MNHQAHLIQHHPPVASECGGVNWIEIAPGTMAYARQASWEPIRMVAMLTVISPVLTIRWVVFDSRQELAKLQGQGKAAVVRRVEQQIKNLQDSIMDESDSRLRDLLKRRLTEKLDEKVTTEQELKASETELITVDNSHQSLKTWQANFETLRKSLGDVNVRLKLQGHLRELIERIDVFAHGFENEFDADNNREGETMAEAMEEYLSEARPRSRPDKTFRKFQRYVVQRLMSKEGRFLRVTFKTGARVDIVPEGSLATGLRLTDDGNQKGWRSVAPRLSKLWEQFQKSQKRKIRHAAMA